MASITRKVENSNDLRKLVDSKVSSRKGEVAVSIKSIASEVMKSKAFNNFCSEEELYDAVKKAVIRARRDEYTR